MEAPRRMKGVIRMAEKINVLFSEEEVDARIRQMGEQISRDYAGREVHLICVLKGGSFFMWRILWIPDIP